MATAPKPPSAVTDEKHAVFTEAYLIEMATSLDLTYEQLAVVLDDIDTGLAAKWRAILERRRRDAEPIG